jgi:hypothetical protein
MARISDAGCVPSDSPPSRTLLRRFTLGSGPLKRGCDRVEVAVRVAVLCLLLLAAPAGLVAGNVTAGSLHASTAARTAALHREPAVLLADAPPAEGSTRSTVPTRATWAAPDGSGRTGTVAAPRGAHAGSAVGIWVDDAGTPVPAPATGPQITAQGALAGVLTALALLIAAGSAQLCAGWWLARHRASRWAAAWATVEPLWASRLR